MMPYKRIQFIINPAAGNDEPILSMINDVLKETDVDWQVSITHKAGDGAKFAKEAIAAGVDLVVAYGGDGTLLDVAEGMLNAPIPMGMLAGGTANAMIEEIGVPRAIADATKLFIGEHAIRSVDVGEINGKNFLLRAGTGMIEDFSVGVNRDMKDRYGLIAYFIGSAKALFGAKVHKYKITVDGEVHEAEGVMCLITNASSTGGQANVRIAREVLIDDGLLDVIIPKGDLTSYVDIILTAAQVNRESFQSESVYHFQGRDIYLEAEEPLGLYADGEEEPIGTTPTTIKVLPNALRVIVPQATE
jgi:YegS/Rv2252/BmrU family lipid kinase